MKPFADPAIAEIFSKYPAEVRERLLNLREIIFRTARSIPSVGPVEETLKWGQPSYLTAETKSGSTVRLDALKSKPGSYALYFHCQTNLIETFRKKYGSAFNYEGNRALIFASSDSPSETKLRECVAAALTYHSQKRGPRKPIGDLIR